MQSTSVVSVPATPVTMQAEPGTDASAQAGEAFSQALEQASESLSAAQTPESAAQAPAPASNQSQSQSQSQQPEPVSTPRSDSSAEPVQGTTEATAADDQQATLADAQVDAPPIEMPVDAQTLQAAAAAADDDTPIEVTSARLDPGLADVQAAQPDDETVQDDDNPLNDIRQRMALIESAGQLDTAASLLVPALPVATALQTAQEAATPLQDDPLQDDLLSSDALALQAGWSAAPVTARVQAPDDNPLPPEVAVETGQADSGPMQGAQSSVESLQRSADSTDFSSLPTTSLQGDTATGLSVSAATTAATAAATTITTAATAATTVADGLVLASAVGSDSWSQELGQQVVELLRRGDQQVDLTLHPHDLGPLSISLSVSDGTTQARFQSAHAAVRSAVEQALPQLREALASQGITLGQASVSDESSRQAWGERARRETGSQSDEAAGQDGQASQQEVPVQSLSLSGTGVDLYI